MEKNNTGDRLCDHFKKAVETKKETEDQLNLLMVKLNETGVLAVYLQVRIFIISHSMTL